MGAEKVGGFCCPVPPEPRFGRMSLATVRQRDGRPQRVQRCRWHFYKWPDNGGTMPGTTFVFTTHVEPVSSPWTPRNRGQHRVLEEDGGDAGHCPRVRYAYSTKGLAP